MRRPVLPIRRLLAAGALVVLAAMGVPRAEAQGALDDTTAWERLGAERQSIWALGFSDDTDEPTVWAGYTDFYRLDAIDAPWVRVHIRPSDDPILFLGDPFGAAGPDTILTGRSLYRSLDGGDTFARIETPAGGDDGRIGSNGALGRFPSSSPYPLRLVSGDSPSLVYSDDGGDSWTRAETAPRHQAFRLHTFRSGRVLSVGFYGAALSTDGGVTFTHVPALYDTARVAFDLTELVVLDGFVTGQPGDSEEGRVLVLGTQAGRPGTHVWASDDEGDTWRQVHQFEWGGTWDAAAAVPEAEVGEPGWAVAAEDPGRVFATVDGGATWVRIGAVPGAGESPPGGGYVRVQTMEVGPDGRLYAGTSRSGPNESWSYRSRKRIAEVIRFATAAEEVIPEAGSLDLTVHPNPAASTTDVVVRLGAGTPPTEAVLTVTDVQGREVARLEGDVAGEASFRLETSGWASGVYVVRVTVGSEAATASFTVAR